MKTLSNYTRRTSLMEAAVSFLALPIQLGNPQIVPFSFTLILIMSDHFLIIIFSAVKKNENRK